MFCAFFSFGTVLALLTITEARCSGLILNLIIMTKEKIYQMFGVLVAVCGALHVTSMDVMTNMTVMEVLKQFLTGMLIFIIGMLIAVWNVPVDYFK